MLDITQGIPTGVDPVFELWPGSKQFLMGHFHRGLLGLLARDQDAAIPPGQRPDELRRTCIILKDRYRHTLAGRGPILFQMHQLGKDPVKRVSGLVTERLHDLIGFGPNCTRHAAHRLIGDMRKGVVPSLLKQLFQRISDQGQIPRFLSRLLQYLIDRPGSNV